MRWGVSINPDHVPYDNAAALREADARFGIERVIEQYGHAPQNGRWSSFTCPFCHKKNKAGVFQADGSGVKMFKCQSASCPTGAAAMPAVKYIAYVANLSSKDAFEEYLKQAGVWRERTTLRSPVADSPTISPVPQAKSDAPALDGVAAPGAAGQTLNRLISEEWIKAETSPTTDVLEGPLVKSLDEIPSDQVGELEQAALLTGVIVSREEFEADEKRRWEIEIAQCVELFRQERRASVSRLKQKFQIGQSRANRLMDDMQARGYIGPAVAGEPRKILHLPPPSSPETNPSGAVASGDKAVASSSPIPGVAATATPGSGPAVHVRANDGKRSLRAFYDRITLLYRDEELMFVKRGLDSQASRGLGFKSNVKANRDLLIAIEQEFGFEDAHAAGLWLREDARAKKERRPNSQFFGAGRIRKLKRDESPGRGQWKDEDGTLWGWCEPILIPYFDELGALISLRPHKGMGRSGTLVGTSHVYIPRLAQPTSQPEIFPKVVITEGEFKAACLWRYMAVGRKEPLGVCALPGISFAKNYECRQVLDDWLKRIRCGHVIVAFDNEEKGDPKLYSYKPDSKNSWDSIIWARFLATDIYRKLHIRAEVCILPNAWRNAQGKADWDGRAAQLNAQACKKAA